MSNGAVAIYNIWQPITPSDTVNFDQVPRSGGLFELCDAIWVGGAGIVIAVMSNGITGAFTCTAGTLLPVGAIRVNATGTTATLMLAIYQQ